MYLQTRNYHVPDYNLLVQSNADAAGGKVFIDGRERGTLVASSPNELSGSIFRDKLAPGKHVIELQKPGFEPVRRTIVMRLESFVGMNLSEASH